MKKNYFLLILFFSLGVNLSASTDKDSTQVSIPKHAEHLAILKDQFKGINLERRRVLLSPAPQTRTFSSFDDQLLNSYLKRTQRTQEFSDEYLERIAAVDTTVNEFLAKAVGTFDELENNQNWIETLQPSDLVELPVGVRQTINNVQYMMGISGATFTPEYTELTVFFKMILPQQDAAGNQKQFFFGATGIRLSHTGGLIGDATLALLGDVPFRINGGNGLVIVKGGFEMATGEVNDRTYVKVDCDGFKELGLQAEVEFPRSMLVPLKPDYTVETDTTKRVKGEFSTTASDWNDILVNVSIPRFALASWQDGLAFDLNTAVLDFSDLRNDPQVQWPQDYSQYLVPGNEELWRGVYVSSLTVALPEQFKRKGSTERITFQAVNLLIDGMGVSGEFSVNNVLPLNEGDASKWQFSLDRIEATFVANNLTGAELRGGIVLPISKEVDADQAQAFAQTQQNPDGNGNNGDGNGDDDQDAGGFAMAYVGIVNPANNEYVFTATTQSQLKFDVWKATATIEPNSSIELTVQDGKFRPVATIHGSMGIYADASEPSEATGDGNNDGNNNDPNTTPDDEKTVQFTGVTFQSLVLQTETPYVSVGSMGYDGTVSLAKFPITISDIDLTTTNNTATLGFTIAVNFMGDTSGFSGDTTLGIEGKFEEDDGIQKWKFDKITVDEINVLVDLGATEFAGSVTFLDDDPIYGDGFQGSLSAKFKTLGSNPLEITANAMFGKTGFRYWYVDALADGLNINTGGAFKIKGFGGGAYYKMEKVGFSSNFTASGADYQPNEDSGLGIKAMILFANAANDNVFHGGAGFEVAFNSTGGLNRVSIYGEGHVMQDFSFDNPAAQIQDKLESVVMTEMGMNQTTLDYLKDTNLIEVSKQVYPDEVSGQVGINAYAAIEYNFTTSTLHGTFDLYVDAAGGLIKGRASGNRAGWAVLHFEPGSWYIHMGTPTDRLGLRVGIGSFSLESGGYFMIGDNIPASPPPPPIVADLLGVDADVLDYMRDENMLGDGRGLAFGQDFALDTGDLTFLVFYARFQVGAGFDIMVKDYGDAACQGSGQIGIDGWYANGQAYAYLQGELGIKIKLLFVRKKIPIISAGAAMLMQAKLPNPTWFRGYVGGQFNLLGGLVKGSFNFKIELGEECELINGGPLDGLKVIADIQPNDGVGDVDVFSIPQVGFNMQLNNAFQLDDEDTGQTQTYRITLNEFKLLDAGNEIEGEMTWNDDNNLVTFRSTDVLPPTTDIELRVSVIFEKYSGGSWQVYTENGEEFIEEEIRNFTTGEAPDYIPESNIAYCYPVLDQKYMYPNETNQAYIKLLQGQDYLFDLEDGWSQVTYYTTTTTVEEGAITYNSADNIVMMGIPTLETSQAYAMTLATLPPGSDPMDNVTTSYDTVDIGEDQNVEVQQIELDDLLTNADAIQMLAYNFSTSQYTTFANKLAAKAVTAPIIDIIQSNIHALEIQHATTEPFDLVEILGNQYTNDEPLISIEASLDDTYYQNEVYPLIYEGYPINGFTTNRDVSIMGIPPVKAVEMLTWYITYLENDPNFNLLSIRFPYRYNLPLYYEEDFVDIRYKITNAYLNDPVQYQQQIQQFDYIINGVFPYLKQGNYNIDISYQLPGTQDGNTSTYTFNKPN
ncbi:hypothetical protein GCM10009117_14650 [Gangjinia marincola]|uniref:Uncharacterized protein n=1 Tax=Gangjinia marincola TaxID=578463 RepID=A0ABP3XVM3_9FLAO